MPHRPTRRHHRQHPGADRSGLDDGESDRDQPVESDKSHARSVMSQAGSVLTLAEETLQCKVMRVKFILPALTEATGPYWRPIKYSLFPPLGLAQLPWGSRVDIAVRRADKAANRASCLVQCE